MHPTGVAISTSGVKSARNGHRSKHGGPTSAQRSPETKKHHRGEAKVEQEGLLKIDNFLSSIEENAPPKSAREFYRSLNQKTASEGNIFYSLTRVPSLKTEERKAAQEYTMEDFEKLFYKTMSQDKLKIVGKEHVRHNSKGGSSSGKTRADRPKSQRCGKAPQGASSKERSPGVTHTKTTKAIVTNDNYNSYSSKATLKKEKILRLPKKAVGVAASTKGLHFRTTSHKEFNLQGLKTQRERTDERAPPGEVSALGKSSRSRERKKTQF